mmetsp:Transcript_58807/g.140018  ORF Transcript_58807/g.140018 Transcript_58807/m.140018 type:complete len:205 (-) Transcript_58807:44-658(-)
MCNLRFLRHTRATLNADVDISYPSKHLAPLRRIHAGHQVFTGIATDVAKVDEVHHAGEAMQCQCCGHGFLNTRQAPSKDHRVAGQNGRQPGCDGLYDRFGVRLARGSAAQQANAWAPRELLRHRAAQGLDLLPYHILLLPQRQLQLCALCGHLQLLVLSGAIASCWAPVAYPSQQGGAFDILSRQLRLGRFGLRLIAAHPIPRA